MPRAKRKTKAKAKSKARSKARSKASSRRTSSRASSSTRTRKPKGTRTVNFKGVESGGARIPEGIYPVKVKAVDLRKGQESGAEYYNWEFRTHTPKNKSTHNKPLWFSTSLQEQALFNLRNTLECLGVEVPEGPYDIVPAELEGLECFAEVADETYEGRKRSRIIDLLPEDEGEEEPEGEEEEDVDVEEEEEEGEDEDEGEDLEPLSEDEVLEMSGKDLGETIEEYGLEVDLGDYKTLGKKRNAVLDALEEAGYIEEPED